MISFKKIIIFFSIFFLITISILEIPSVHNFAEENLGFSLQPSDLLGKKLANDAVEIVTSKNKYKIGEEIFFAIQNRTDKTIKIENDCPFEPLEIYFFEQGKWKHLKGSSNKIGCSQGKNKDIVIEPYELKGASFLPWSNIIFKEPGKYKLEIEIIGYKNIFKKEFEIVK